MIYDLVRIGGLVILIAANVFFVMRDSSAPVTLADIQVLLAGVVGTAAIIA